ncbi:DUF3696 domain-containing protein [Pseudomonas sp. BLCC-B112]|uniref:DUF3696 domain-containing protein n=1 Tax=Pseudomonas sp. BLCC-B112 TaxID=3025319 RepID=UPI00234DDA1A|nr:DUF3696 domain-containing protein [Pseudomonas sp. BLCC-B112]MDC7814425.1 DUF3696 domain-containing protein [Pseudomonas sp. BLCC-B112]
MLRSLSLKHFKSITNNTPINFENFSILCGSNSSGKSSLIQAMLMLSQTFSSRYFKSSISLNGHLVRLGSFSDIIDHTSDSKEINIKMDMEFTKDQLWISGVRSVSLDYTFGPRDDHHKGYESQFHPNIIKGTATVCNQEGHAETITFEHSDSAKFNNEELFYVSNLSSKEVETLNKDYPDFRIEGCGKLEIIPSSLKINYDHTKKISLQLIPFLIGTPNYLRQVRHTEASELDNIIIPKAFLDKARALINAEYKDRMKNFVIPDVILNMVEEDKAKDLDLEQIRVHLARQSLVLTSDVIPESLRNVEDGIDIGTWRTIVNSLDEKAAKAFNDFLIRNRETLQGVWYANTKRVRRRTNFHLTSFQELDHYLNFVFGRSVKYLGPLRNEPQAMYQAFDLSEPTNVGLKGEYTAAVLHINKGVKIGYPSITSNENNSINIEKKYKTLEEACTDWLTYLGVVTSVKTTDKGKLGYELLVKTEAKDNWQDLTHVGVGVSQILPIVVMALLASDDDILIFEQPELHLHPKVQSRLCDFFIAISQGATQCIIETHSEYMINRLRLRIAQSRTSNISDRSSILFIEKTNGKSSFRPVDITKFGSIIDWPKDFFDQTDTEVENILLEAAKKKRELTKSQGVLK